MFRLFAEKVACLDYLRQDPFITRPLINDSLDPDPQWELLSGNEPVVVVVGYERFLAKRNIKVVEVTGIKRLYRRFKAFLKTLKIERTHVPAATKQYP